ncbi:MAG: hypothetical protein FJX74_26205, partial [Armatimonadetes bacterium]|nr:hypothetical protein [Armatimonadota bacterium]
MRATGVAGVGLLVVALGVALSERGTSGADSRAGLAKRLTDELDFTIPPGSGEKQLRAFTALTGIACAVLVRVLPQRELPAISGHMQVRSALDLLAGNAD